MKVLFSQKRIDGFASDIEKVVWPELDHTNFHGVLREAIRKESKAYNSGLTNGEHCVAVVQALANMQRRAIAVLASLQMESGDFDEDEAA
jgi:hypothetical protein